MKIFCPQCGHSNSAPASKCEKCGVGFTVQIKPAIDQRFLAYLLFIILFFIFLAQYLGVFNK